MEYKYQHDNYYPSFQRLAVSIYVTYMHVHKTYVTRMPYPTKCGWKDPPTVNNSPFKYRIDSLALYVILKRSFYGTTRGNFWQF